MSKVEHRLQEMLQIQDETNCRLNPDWLNQGWNFSLAAKIEAAEAIDHLGYKWWSNKPADYDQARMECVDMWHFLLSALIGYKDSEAFMESVCNLETWVERVTPTTEEPGEPWGWFQSFLGEVAIADLIYVFAKCCTAVHLTFDQLYKFYIGKAALNRFRWANDYGTTYPKIWDGREDNEHLTEILNDLDDKQVSLDFIFNKLSERYTSLTG